MIRFRDALLMLLVFVVSAAATATTVAVAVVEPTLLDLPYLVIAGACGASMMGGVIGTLMALHRAQSAGVVVKSVPMLLVVNLAIALALGVLTWVCAQKFEWSNETLLGLLVLVGISGEAVMTPVMAAFQKAAETAAARLLGSKNKDGL